MPPSKIYAPSFLPTFKMLQREIWDICGEGHSSGCPAHEPSLTQHLLRGLRVNHPHDCFVFPFTAPEEIYTGADWIWWLTDEVRWIGFYVQAKRLDTTTQRYSSLDYTPAGESQTQLDTLIARAAGQSVEPLYAFYNWTDTPTPKNWNCGTYLLQPTLLGVTVASALQVKNALDTSGDGLASISPVSWPMHCLVGCTGFTRDQDPSLPEIADTFVKGALHPGTDFGLKEGPPDYVKRLLDTPPDQRGPVVKDIRKELKVSGVVVLRKKSPKAV
jgi:hypothetical protein